MPDLNNEPDLMPVKASVLAYQLYYLSQTSPKGIRILDLPLALASDITLELTNKGWSTQKAANFFNFPMPCTDWDEVQEVLRQAIQNALASAYVDLREAKLCS